MIEYIFIILLCIYIITKVKNNLSLVYSNFKILGKIKNI